MSFFEGGFLPDFMDTLQYWYDHGIRMFKFDFVDLTRRLRRRGQARKGEIQARNLKCTREALQSFGARNRMWCWKPSMGSAATWIPRHAASISGSRGPSLAGGL